MTRALLILSLIFFSCHPERSEGAAPRDKPKPQQGRISDRRLIEYAKKIPVKQFDAQLPAIPFGSWLRQAAGHDVRISWEVNDCGEQTGDPEVDAERELPLCVAADLYLPSGTEAMIMIQVGNETQAPGGEPALRMLAVRPDRNSDWRDIEHLRELPGKLLTSYPE